MDRNSLKLFVSGNLVPVTQKSLSTYLEHALLMAACQEPMKGCEAMRRHRSCRAEMMKQLGLVHIEAGATSSVCEDCALCAVMGDRGKEAMSVAMIFNRWHQ